jgi:PAS domain S-box-containing protein
VKAPISRFFSDSTILRHLPIITYVIDCDGAITFVKHELAAGCVLEPAPRAEWLQKLHADDRERVATCWSEAVTIGAPYNLELRFLSGGGYRWFACRGTPLRDASGTLLGYAGTASDIDAQKRAENSLHALTEIYGRVSAREGLYARLSEELSKALSLAETADVMLRAIIPEFADWMSVYLEKRDGEGFEVIAMRHWDEGRQPIIDALLGTSFATESSATAQVLRTGEPVLLERYPQDLRERAIRPEHALQLQQLGLRSAIVVPFRDAGKVIGAIHVIRGDNPQDFAYEDLLLVEELARRITPAIRNAEAYERERVVARRFQEAALPMTLLETPGLEFDAVYEAAKTEATVGGDWYDAFRIDHERILISIGDVAGHGLRAATIMAMLRQSLRAFSLTTAAPGELMFLLRSLLAKEYPDVFATAFIGVLWPLSGRLEHVSAGHPAPLIRFASGRIEELEGDRRPLLGIAHPKRATCAQTILERDSLLVLYTDGVTEATRDVVEGERRLRVIVESAQVGNASDPAHVIHRTMIPHGSFDDTAILCVRYRGPLALTAQNA